jgi:hypothetical protein
MLAALVAMGRVSPYVLMFAFAAELLWLLYFAAPFVVFNLAEELSTFGEGLGAVEKKMAVVSAVSEGRAWGVIIGRALTLGVLAFAMLGSFRRWRLGYRDGLAAAMMLSALPLMANRYGGEVHFRVYLFALPMLALFAAAAFFPTAGRGTGRVTLAAFAITAVLGVIGFLFANNGKDREYTFARDEVDAAAWLYGRAPPNSLLIEGARNYPSQFMNYENFAYLPISEENRNVRNALIAAPEQTLARWLSAGAARSATSRLPHCSAREKRVASSSTKKSASSGCPARCRKAMMACPHRRAVRRMASTRSCCPRASASLNAYSVESSGRARTRCGGA